MFARGPSGDGFAAKHGADPAGRGVQAVNIDTSTALGAIAAPTDRPRRAVVRGQIQPWNSINRLNVAIDVPTKAAETGSMTANPAAAITT